MRKQLRGKIDVRARGLLHSSSLHNGGAGCVKKWIVGIYLIVFEQNIQSLLANFTCD